MMTLMMMMSVQVETSTTSELLSNQPSVEAEAANKRQAGPVFAPVAPVEPPPVAPVVGRSVARTDNRT